MRIFLFWELNFLWYLLKGKVKLFGNYFLEFIGLVNMKFLSDVILF